MKNPTVPLSPDTATQLLPHQMTQNQQHQLQPHTVSSLINLYNSNLRTNTSKKPALKTKPNPDSSYQNGTSTSSRLNPNRPTNNPVLNTSNAPKSVEFQIKRNKVRSLSENNFNQDEDDESDELDYFRGYEDSDNEYGRPYDKSEKFKTLQDQASILNVIFE